MYPKRAWSPGATGECANSKADWYLSGTRAGGLTFTIPAGDLPWRQWSVPPMKSKQVIFMATVKDPTDTRGRLIAASQVNGTNVYNPAGEKLGHIYDVMLDKVSGKADYAIMSFGGFLGIGDRYHPLPWQVLKYDPVQGGYVVNIDRRRLEGAPSYAANETTLWDDPAYGRRVSDYYGGVLTP